VDHFRWLMVQARTCTHCLSIWIFSAGTVTFLEVHLCSFIYECGLHKFMRCNQNQSCFKENHILAFKPIRRAPIFIFQKPLIYIQGSWNMYRNPSKSPRWLVPWQHFSHIGPVWCIWEKTGTYVISSKLEHVIQWVMSVCVSFFCCCTYLWNYLFFRRS
jgi:hypothetical protein